MTARGRRRNGSHARNGAAVCAAARHRRRVRARARRGARYEDLMRLLGTTEVQSDSSEYRKNAKALAELEPLVERFREYKTIVNDITGAEELAAAGDAEMRELAREELRSLNAKRDALVGEL